MTFNRLFVLHHFNVLIHLFEQSYDDGFSLGIVLGPTSSTEDLLYVEHADIFICTSLRVIDFRSFNNDCVSGQIDSPRESAGRT